MLRLLAVVGLLTVVFAPPARAATHAITIANFAFSPATETVAEGDTVTWANTDQAPHDVTVTSGPAAIHSPTIETGQAWTYTFTTPGTYSYICSIHPNMHATLVVTPTPAPTTRIAVAPPRTITHPATTQPTTAPMTMPMPTSNAVAAEPGGQPPPTATTQAAAATAAQPGINPLLLVAGLVAAVATLCLLLLGSRPEND